MIKVKFKTKKTLYNNEQRTEQYQAPRQEPFPTNTDSEYFANREFSETFEQNTPQNTPQDTEPPDCSCNICGGEISGNCLEVTFKQNRFHVHTSCIVSAFAVILNGVGFLADWLLRKKKNKNN